MKIDKGTITRWKKYAHLLLHEHGHTVEDVTDIGQAWQIAHRLDIPREAYHIDNTVNDDHIETALRRMFPNVANARRW